MKTMENSALSCSKRIHRLSGMKMAFSLTLFAFVWGGWSGISLAADERVTLTFTLDSLPSEAEVRYAAPEGERIIGRTPLTLDIPFEPEDQGRRLNPFGKRVWQPVPDTERPVRIRYEDEELVFDFPGLSIHKEGYAPEPWSSGWTLPADLRQREGLWGNASVANHYEATVVFQTPVEPQTTHTIEIDSVPSGAYLHAFDKEGRQGALIGQTPITFNLGFAPVRSDTGAITNWARWHGETGALWTHSPDGVVMLNAVLEMDGYELQPVINRPLFKIDPETNQTYRTDIPMLRPTRPTGQFQLETDSLPTSATIYALRPDGSLANILGETPHTFEIGVAQMLTETPDGKVVHADWRVWDPYGILSWENHPDGSTIFTFICAVYKEDYAVKRVSKRAFVLQPGQPIPQNATVTLALTPDREVVLGTIGPRRPLVWQSMKPDRPTPWESDVEAESFEPRQMRSYLKRFRR